jgi:ribosomal protein S15P/S13E
MIAGATRNEPYLYEEFLIEDTLESAPGQEALLATIEKLVEEQHELRIQLAQHPLKDQAAKERMRAINSQLRALWTEVRRIRAVRRVALEEALGIDAAFIIN